MKNFQGLVDVDGQMLYAEYAQNFRNRPTIVFLHDSLGCVKLWRDFPQKLADAVQCDTLVYDRLGYGQSAPMKTHVRPVDYMEREADILNTLLAHFNINDAILFGHSDGGTIALLTANKHPYRVKMAICEAAHIFVEDVTLKGIFDAKESYANSNLPQRLAKYHGDKVDTLFKAWTETWTRPDYRDWNIETILTGIQCPILFIQGEHDEFGTLEQVNKTIAGVSGPAEKRILPNIGHSPHKEAPQTVIDIVTRFLQKHV